ncbi:Cell shape-determining protein MreC [Azospirillaceae bacterium]
MKARASRSMVRLTALKTVLQRFSFIALVVMSVALMMAGRVDPALIEGARSRVTDAFTPILEAISRPAATAAHVIETFVEISEVHHENKQLRQENARLQQWKQAALRLEAENNSLRSLLHFKPEPAASFISARVVAAPGGSFLRALVVTAGRRDGVHRGQAAMAGPGMVGRVVEVGEWSARVLMITDINTRIPVLLEGSRQRAILAGDNSDQPRLLHLPPEAPVAVGDRVVTSGHGGQFPPGLPIGVVASVTERLIKIQPLADLGRIEHLQLVDFGMPGGLVSETERIATFR